MASLFADYFRVEEGLEVVETEFGFFAYNMNPATKTMFLSHVYVDPEARKVGGTAQLFQMIRDRAARLCATHVVGNIFRNETNKADYTKKVMLHLRHGYQIIDVHDNCITVMKEL